jgi:hypothetical protein
MSDRAGPVVGDEWRFHDPIDPGGGGAPRSAAGGPVARAGRPADATDGSDLVPASADLAAPAGRSGPARGGPGGSGTESGVAPKNLLRI